MRSAAPVFFVLSTFGVLVALCAGCGGSPSDPSGAGATERQRQTARFTMDLSRSARAVWPVGIGTIDVDVGLVEIRYTSPAPPETSGADAEQAGDGAGGTTVLHDFHGNAVYTDLAVVKKMGFADVLEDKQWLRTPVSDLGELVPSTAILLNPYGFDEMKAQARRAIRVGSDRIDGDVMTSWELTIDFTAQFGDEPVETETATLTAWVGDRDHPIHRLRTNDPSDADSPGSATLIEFTDFGEPVDLDRPDPSSVVDRSELADLIEPPQDPPSVVLLTDPGVTETDIGAPGIERFTGSIDLKDLGLDTEDIQAAIEELRARAATTAEDTPYVATSPATDTAP
ncbi:MAG: hypothetical protein R3C15_20845 [Thermoleophilia bacterium]